MSNEDAMSQQQIDTFVEKARPMLRDAAIKNHLREGLTVERIIALGYAASDAERIAKEGL